MTYTAKQPSPVRVAAVRSYMPALRAAHQPGPRSVPGTANSQLFTPPTVGPHVRKPDRSSVPVSGSFSINFPFSSSISYHKNRLIYHTSDLFKPIPAHQISEIDSVFSHCQLSIFVEHIISQRPSLTLRYSPIFCDILLYNFNCHMIHSSSHHTRSIFPA